MYTTTEVKSDILSGVQTGSGIPYDRYKICGIAHARTNRKDNIFKQICMYSINVDVDCFFLMLWMIVWVICEMRLLCLNSFPGSDQVSGVWMDW